MTNCLCKWCGCMDNLYCLNSCKCCFHSIEEIDTSYRLPTEREEQRWLAEK